MMAIQLTDSGVKPVVITGSQLFMTCQFHCVHPFRDLQFTRPDKMKKKQKKSSKTCSFSKLVSSFDCNTNVINSVKPCGYDVYLCCPITWLHSKRHDWQVSLHVANKMPKYRWAARNHLLFKESRQCLHEVLLVDVLTVTAGIWSVKVKVSLKQETDAALVVAKCTTLLAIIPFC